MELRMTPRGARLAELIGRRLFSAYRGCLVEGRGPGRHLVVFGNDGYDLDERARREVEAALAFAEENDLTPADFGTGGGVTWALRLRPGKAVLDRPAPAPAAVEKGRDARTDDAAPDLAWPRPGDGALAELAAELEQALWRAWLGADLYQDLMA